MFLLNLPATSPRTGAICLCPEQVKRRRPRAQRHSRQTCSVIAKLAASFCSSEKLHDRPPISVLVEIHLMVNLMGSLELWDSASIQHHTPWGRAPTSCSFPRLLISRILRPHTMRPKELNGIHSAGFCILGLQKKS